MRATYRDHHRGGAAPLKRGGVDAADLDLATDERWGSSGQSMQPPLHKQRTRRVPCALPSRLIPLTRGTAVPGGGPGRVPRFIPARAGNGSNGTACWEAGTSQGPGGMRPRGQEGPSPRRAGNHRWGRSHHSDRDQGTQRWSAVLRSEFFEEGQPLRRRSIPPTRRRGPLEFIRRGCTGKCAAELDRNQGRQRRVCDPQRSVGKPIGAKRATGQGLAAQHTSGCDRQTRFIPARARNGLD